MSGALPGCAAAMPWLSFGEGSWRNVFVERVGRMSA